MNLAHLTEAAEVMEEAADLLDVSGWVQGVLADGDAHCLIGAVGTVLCRRYQPLYDGGPNDRLRRTVHHIILQDLTHSIRGDVATWNDASERTHGEVTDLLRRTAKQLRENP